MRFNIRDFLIRVIRAIRGSISVAAVVESRQQARETGPKNLLRSAMAFRKFTPSLN
jgi:hypothetical protein